MIHDASKKLGCCILIVAGGQVLSAQSANVAIDNFAFTPTPVTVAEGASVVWTNQQSGVAHTVVSDNGKFPGSKNLNTKDTFTTTLTTSGTYTYHCSIHPFMKGTIVVQSAATGPVVSAAGVANGATNLAGAVSPGEILVLFGSGLGPATLAGSVLNAAGLVDTTVGETRVLFDGIAAPMIYSSAGQIATVVPYEVGSQQTTVAQVEYKGQLSSPMTLQVASAAPGIFSSDSSGKGAGAILNQDGSVNSALNPAGKGSVVSVFGTGAGLVSPGGIDGKLAVAPYPAPIQKVQAILNGTALTPLYAGSAPGLVEGVLQVNVQIPSDASSGPLSLAIQVGDVKSPPGITVSVK